MQESFEDLCVLVNKKGVCYQCSGLREGCSTDKQGPEVPVSLPMEERLRIVSNAELDSGKSQLMHDVFYRRTAQQEAAGIGDEKADSKCREEEKPTDNNNT